MGVFVLLKEEEKEDRLNSHGDLINSRKKMGATFAKQYESPFFQPFQQRKALWGSKTPLASRMGRISPRNGIDSRNRLLYTRQPIEKCKQKNQ